MKHYKIAAGFAVLMIAVSGAALTANAAGPSHQTKGFIEDASAAGMFEVDSSKIALQKSSNEDIKTFAQKMVDDHTAAGDTLKSTVSADQQKYLSTTETKKQKGMLDTLNKDSASDFDKDYVKYQVKAHDQAVDLFKKYSEKGDDANLKAFAAKTLPTLTEHKTMIADINSKMK